MDFRNRWALPGSIVHAPLQFWCVNALFILLLILGAVSSSLTFKRSLDSLLLLNVLMPLIPTLVLRQYSPGVISALSQHVDIIYKKSLYICMNIIRLATTTTTATAYGGP